MIYKFDNEKYMLCKKYVLPVYKGSKDDIKFNDEQNQVAVSKSGEEDFIDAADYSIIHYGMVNQDYLTDLGCKLQWLYDEIYYQTQQQK